MSLIIRTAYGSTSDGRYKLTKKFTRIGASDDSDIKTLEDGTPEFALLLEQREQKTTRAHCQVGNCVRIGGKLLKKGEVVDWELDEEIDVCGAVRFVLEEETKEVSKRPSLDSSFVASRATVAKSVRSRRSMGNEELLTSKRVSVTSTSLRNDGKSEENKSTSNMSDSAMIAVIVASALICVVMLASFSVIFRSNDKKGLTYEDAYYLLDGTQLSNPFETNELPSFNDPQLAKTFQFATINEQTEPARALAAYQRLRDDLRVSYAEKFERDDLESEKGGHRNSFNYVNRFVESRIASLRMRLGD